MKNDGQDFLEQLAGSTADTFESRFSLISRQLGLGTSFTRNELTLLYDAASRAAHCNAAINGLDDYGPGIKAEHEPRRHSLELEFLEARDIFYASPGWQTLPAAEQGPIDQAFLSVFVAEDKLAPSVKG